jgi:arylsulfatase A-like enzyme
MGPEQSRHPRRVGTAIASLAGLLALLGTLDSLSVEAAGAAPRAPDPRPNVIVVITDDQSVDSFTAEYMPRTFRHFVEPGTEFTESIVATPLCCPSRATLLTGQYGHNNGVLRNQYRLLQDKRNVLPAWLRRTGYKTMHVGRFLNGYRLSGRDREVAPGWTHWRTVIEPHSYYDYALRFNDRTRDYGARDRDYLTTNINRLSEDLLRRHAGKRRPFYLQIDQFAPHFGPGSRGERCEGGPVPAPADEAGYLDEPLPIDPSFNEADISDKPEFMQSLEPIGPEGEDELTETWRCGLAALQEVDRGMAALWKALKEGGELRDTAVIFTSDNGYLLGQHRISLDKHYPYERALRVPLAIRLPRSAAPQGQRQRSAAPVANIDLAPTILDLANVHPCKARRCRVPDGRSLLPAALGEPGIPADRAIAIEYSGEVPIKGLVCEYQGLRSTQQMFVEHTRGRSSLDDDCAALPEPAHEHYLIAGDPFQLENRYPAPAGSGLAVRQQELAARSAALADCSGIAGRDSFPASGHYCE